MSHTLNSAIYTLVWRVGKELCADSTASLVHLVSMEYVRYCCASILIFDCPFAFMLFFLWERI